MSLAPELLDILVCPKCKGDLEYRTEASPSPSCATPARSSTPSRTASR